MCKTFNIYMWAGQYVVYDWIRYCMHIEIQHAEISYLLYFVTQVRGYSALSKNVRGNETTKYNIFCTWSKFLLCRLQRLNVNGGLNKVS